MFLILLIFFIIDIIFLAVFHKNKYMYVLVQEIFGILFLAITCMFFVAKFSNYKFLLDIDYSIYLYIQRIQLHPLVVNDVYIFAHCIYLSASIIFLGVNTCMSKRKYILAFIPIIYLFTVNLSSFSWNVLMMLNGELSYFNKEFLAGLFHFLFNDCSHIIILVYAFTPLILSVRSYIRTENIIKKNYFFTYSICLFLNLLLYLSIFVYGTFGSFSPQNAEYTRIPTPFSLEDGVLFPIILLIVSIGSVAVILMYFRPFKPRILSNRSIKSDDFQKIQYKHYFSHLHMMKNTLLSVYKYIESAEQFIENDDAKLRLSLAKGAINEQFEFYETYIANANPKAITLEALKLNDLIEKSLSNISFDKNIVLHKNIYQNDITVLGDRKHLINVFDNLLQNALNSLRLSKKETKELSIDIVPDNDYVLIKITDNGVGIPKKNQKYIFNLFYTTNTNKLCGGIGLYYVKSVIKRHNGAVWFFSNSEKTQFVITFPVINAATL